MVVVVGVGCGGRGRLWWVGQAVVDYGRWVICGLKCCGGLTLVVLGYGSCSWL